MKSIVNFFKTLTKKVKEKVEEKVLPHEVKHLRSTLDDKILESVPKDFINFFDEDFIKDPVMTEFGHVFERSSIEQWLNTNPTSPLTREPLAKEDLVRAPYLKRIIDECKHDYEIIREKILTIQSIKDEEKIIRLVEQFSQRAQVYTQQFEIAKGEEIVQMIRSLKNKLLIDINIPEHLEYWDEQNSCLGIGLIEVKCSDRRFRLSQAVYNVFMAASQEYKRVADFRNAIKEAQSEKLDCWANFWGKTEKSKMVKRADLLKCDFNQSITELKR